MNNPDLIGKTVSHYRVMSLLGRGAWGTVYKAEDTRLRREVALKFLAMQPLNDEQSVRFLHEARAAAALSHPSICTVHEIDEADGFTFIAMAHVEGRTLRQVLDDGPLPLGRALEIVDQVAGGLAEAHGQGVIHRDIKPANIMITSRGRVQIMDFGLAKLTGGTLATETGTVAGTPAYMAPEQARGEATDARCDVWALGALLYELLTGRPAFGGDRIEAMLYQVCHEEPRPLGNSLDNAPAELERLLIRCLAKDPQARFPSAGEFQAALGSLRQDLSGGGPHRLSGPVGHPRRRRILRVAAPLLVLVAAAVAITLRPDFGTGLWSRFAPNGGEDSMHVAVLPFTNLGDEPGGGHFCEGLVEFLTSKLTGLEDRQGKLRMIPASELRKAGITSGAEARQAFGATLAVTGSIQRDRDSLRLTVNLVDTRSLRQIDSAVLETALADAASLQTSVLEQVAGMLGVASSPAAGSGQTGGVTSSSPAYVHYLLGRGMLIRHDDPERLNAAIHSFEQALKEDADYALAEAALGEAWWRRYQVDRDRDHAGLALEHCLRAMELNPRLPETQITLGIIHRETGRPDLALADFERALELAPVSARVYSEMGRALTELGEFERAEAVYKRGIELRPHDWHMHHYLARYHWRRGNLELAEKSFRDVIRIIPDSSDGHSNLGGILLQEGKVAEAKTELEKSLAIRPSYSAHSNLGTMAFWDEDFIKAEEHYREAITLVAGNHRLWARLGMSLIRQDNREDEATAAYERAIAAGENELMLEPRNASLLADLGHYNCQFGDSLASSRYMERALSIEPENPAILFSVGHSYEQLGRRDLAFEFLLKAVQRGYPIERVRKAPTLQSLREDPGYSAFESRLEFQGSQSQNKGD